MRAMQRVDLRADHAEHYFAVDTEKVQAVVFMSVLFTVRWFLCAVDGRGAVREAMRRETPHMHNITAPTTELRTALGTVYCRFHGLASHTRSAGQRISAARFDFLLKGFVDDEVGLSLDGGVLKARGAGDGDTSIVLIVRQNARFTQVMLAGKGDRISQEIQALGAGEMLLREGLHIAVAAIFFFLIYFSFPFFFVLGKDFFPPLSADLKKCITVLHLMESNVHDISFLFFKEFIR